MDLDWPIRRRQRLNEKKQYDAFLPWQWFDSASEETEQESDQRGLGIAFQLEFDSCVNLCHKLWLPFEGTCLQGQQ